MKKIFFLLIILFAVLFSGCLTDPDESNPNIPISENYAFSGEVTDISDAGSNTRITVQNDFVSYGDKPFMDFTIDENILSHQDTPEYQLDVGKHIFLLYEYEDDNVSKQAIVTEATVLNDGMNVALYNGTVEEISTGNTDSGNFILLSNPDELIYTYFFYSSIYCFEEITPGMEVTICGHPFVMETYPAQGEAYAV